jgi:thiamine pyrophosphokinase
MDNHQEGGFSILRAVIFANGELNLPIRIAPQDILIAADGGAKHCLALGLDPAHVIGDLDSLADEELALLKSKGAEIIHYPARKDQTDLELALLHAQALGAQEVTIYGALGARWDQTVANLLLAGAFPALNFRLADANQEFFYIRAGETSAFAGQPGDTVSLIPLGEEAEGITTHNLEYPLKDEQLTFGSTRGVSNVLLAEHASVSLRRGLLLCVVIHKPNSSELEEEK